VGCHGERKKARREGPGLEGVSLFLFYFKTAWETITTTK
jgi:hypothetical protein